MFALVDFTTFQRQVSTQSRKSASEHQLSLETDPVRVLFRFPKSGVDWKADKLLDVASGFVTLHCLSNEIANADLEAQQQQQELKEVQAHRCAVFDSVCEVSMSSELGNELTVNVAMCSVRSPGAGSLARLAVFILALPESSATRAACSRRLLELLRFLDSRFADLAELRAAATEENASVQLTLDGLLERVCAYEFELEEQVVPSEMRKAFDALVEQHVATESRSLFGALVFRDRKLLHNHGVDNETLYAVWRVLRLDGALRPPARPAGELLRLPLHLNRVQLAERDAPADAAHSLSFLKTGKRHFSMVLCTFGKLEVCCLFPGDGLLLEPVTVNAIRRTTMLFDSYMKMSDSGSF